MADNHSSLRTLPYETRRRTDGVGGAAFLLLLLLLVIVGSLVWALWPSAATGIDAKARPRLVEARDVPESAAELANIRIYQQSSPCVVQVTSIGEPETLFGLNVQEVPQGVGSGFVWDTEGHIVTANHVVDGAASLRVTLSDHSVYEAKKVWGYEDQDIAVIWIDAPKSKLHPLPIGSSHNLKVGQIVYALGDPFGLDETMTTGIVSALGREIESSNNRKIRGVIQTSAPINPGNSGGPLFDSAGRLIGMNTAILSPSGAFAGIGFAVPVDEINDIVPQLIRHGKVVQPRLGVQVAEDQTARQLGVDQGALIVKVSPNAAAAKAGLRGTQRQAGRIELGDVIVALDGKPINDSSDLRSALEQYKPGDTVTLTIVRNDHRMDVKVTLGASQ
jgi:S1-C subfamily serine protease